MVKVWYRLGALLLGLHLGIELNHVEATCPLDVAISQVGVKELTGNNDGVEVSAYLASVGLKAGPPWCAAFPHWCYRKCGSVQEPSRSFAMAANWHPRKCRIWQKGDRTKGRISRPGDHFALYYDYLNRIGHTGFIKDETDDYLITVEGNTDGSGSREGDGVYIRKRLKRTIFCISRW